MSGVYFSDREATSVWDYNNYQLRRLNQTSFLMKREGVYYGQCSELCGIAHGFMPIVVEGVSLEKYLV